MCMSAPAGSRRWSRSRAASPTPTPSDVEFGGASADGGRVFFETRQKLTADDTDTGRIDVYERAGGVTTLVSQPSGVADPDTGHVFFSGASADGGRVFFAHTQKLTADDSDTGRFDLYERAGGVTTLVSGPSGVADPDTDAVEFAARRPTAAASSSSRARS